VLRAGEDPQQRRLSAAVGSEDAYASAVGDLEIEVGEDRAPAEGLGDPARGQQGYGGYERASA